MFAAKNQLLIPLAGALTTSYGSSATAEATSMTMPTHNTGDYLLMFAFRDGSTTLPTLPSGWTQINSAAANTCSAILAYKVAASSSETSGTWTSATELVCQVYTNVQGIGASVAGTGSSATVNYPALTPVVTDGKSWLAAFGGHRSVNGTMGNAPTGMTQRANKEGATADAAGFDTNGGATSWSSTNVSSGETASGYITFVVELFDPTSTIPMRITGINSVTGSANSMAIPTHAVGDLIIVWAINSFSTPSTPPAASGTIPAWSLIANDSSGAGGALYSFVATANNHTTGTWSNTNGMLVFVVRGQAAGTAWKGGNAAGGNAFSSPVAVPSITLGTTDGTSIIVQLVGTGGSNNATFPAGYTAQFPIPASTTSIIWLATKDSRTTDGSLNVTLGGGSANSCAQLEIKSH